MRRATYFLFGMLSAVVYMFATPDTDDGLTLSRDMKPGVEIVETHVSTAHTAF